MARRSLVETMALSVRVPRGHEGFWRIIKALAAEQPTFTVTEVAARSNVHDDTVADFVKRLAKAGYLTVAHEERLPGVPLPRFHYHLARTARDAPRLRRDGTEVPETAQETLWRTMKMLKRFTVSTLQMAAETDHRTVPAATTKRYVRHLAEVGVLTRLKAGGGRGREAEFLLARNLGGAAPRILRAHLVFDPNSNTVLGTPEAKEVA